MKTFLNGFTPFAVATVLCSAIGLMKSGPAATVAWFAAWGVGWAVIVGLVSLRRRWDSPALWPILSLVPLWLHFFTAVPVPLAAPGALLLIILIAESRTRTPRLAPSAAPDSLAG